MKNLGKSKTRLHISDCATQTTGIDLQLHLVGGKTPDGWQKFLEVQNKLGNPDWIKHTDTIPHDKLNTVFQQADLFVFASSVETFSIIFVEAMASGLPIAYSNRRPMTDMLGTDGVVLEPEDESCIAAALLKLINDASLRQKCAQGAYNRALAYRWERTARETYQFLKEIHERK